MSKSRGYWQDDARDDEMERDWEQDDVERPQNTVPSYDITDGEDDRDEIDNGMENGFHNDYYDDYEDDYDPVG